MELAYLRDAVDQDAQVGRRLLYLATCLMLIIVAFSWYVDRAGASNRSLTVDRIRQVGDALDRYTLDNGGLLPNAEQGLKALLEEPTAEPRPRNWCGPYVEGPEVLMDAWGFALHYEAPGRGKPRRPYDLWSYGRNDKEGGEGEDADIKHWDPETMTRQ